MKERKATLVQKSKNRFLFDVGHLVSIPQGTKYRDKSKTSWWNTYTLSNLVGCVVSMSVSAENNYIVVLVGNKLLEVDPFDVHVL